LLLLLLLLLLLSSWPNESCETAGRRDGLAFLHASFSQLFHIFFPFSSSYKVYKKKAFSQEI